MTIHKRRKRVSSSDIDMTAYNHNVLNFKVNPLFCCTKNIFVYLMGKIFSRLNDSSIIFFAIKFHNSINNNLCFNPFSSLNKNAERIKKQIRMFYIRYFDNKLLFHTYNLVLYDKLLIFNKNMCIFYKLLVMISS